MEGTSTLKIEKAFSGTVPEICPNELVADVTYTADVVEGDDGTTPSGVTLILLGIASSAGVTFSLEMSSSCSTAGHIGKTAELLWSISVFLCSL